MLIIHAMTMARSKIIALQVLIVCIGLAAMHTVVLAEKRLALVIGNSAYAKTQTLDNPANDARLITASLQQVGFEVDVHTDLSGKKMRRAVSTFARKITEAGPESMALLFYAGHGLQVNGTNFLIPVDADIEVEADVPVEGVSADDVFHTLRSAGANVNIIVLDACRNNPFASAARSMSRGLARMVAPAGSIIAYATAPGRVAADGEGENSPFSAALARTIGEPGLTVEQVFKKVRISVHDETNGAQLPTEENQLLREVYFKPSAGGEETADSGQPPAPVPQPAPEADDKPDAQIAFYRALEVNTIEGYETFLNEHPSHERADQVREIIRSMSEEQMWLRIKKQNTIAAYKRYLIAFADGTYASEANQYIRELQRQAKVETPAPPPAVDPPRPPPTSSGDCGAPHGPYWVTGVRSNDVLNIRAGPSGSQRIVGEIPPDGRGIAIGRCTSNGKWCVVRYRCTEGWAFVKYLTRGGDNGGGTATNLYRVIDHIPPDMLNVRSGPGTKNPITSRIPHNGINVEVSDCRSVGGYRHKWCIVNYRGNRGWAYARYLANMSTGRRPN